MAWISIALISAAIFGWVTVLDKRLISRNMPSLSSYNLWVTCSLFFYGVVFLLASGNPAEVPRGHFLMACLSGLCWGGALALMFLGYKLEEASRASAVIHTFPVFVALLAMIFLDEYLGLGQWVAVMVVVMGAFSISLRSSGLGQPIRLNRAFPVLIGASLFTALAHLTGKYALGEISVWLVAALRNFSMVAVFVFLWRPGAFTQLRQALQNKETLVLLLLAESVLAPFSMLLVIMATNLGPVSIVATITATRPFFVFLYSAILSLPRLGIMDESLERSALLVKMASVMLIVGGISVLTLLQGE